MTSSCSRRTFLGRATVLAGAAAGALVPGPSAVEAAEAAEAPSPPLRFPDGFVWGAATSAYQLEGAAKADGRGESIWDRFSHTPGKTRDGDTGDVSTDHYNRWRQDLDLVRELGLGSYRFSVAWPRVLPSGSGQVNQKGLDFYRRLVDGLHERGIRPTGTLFHWDLPQRLQDAGGWTSRDTAHRFADYAEVVFRALGDRVPVWLTINEPKTIVQNGYIAGSMAPGLRDESAAYVALHHLLLAHGLAVGALRASGSKVRIGPALNLNPVYPADDSAGAKAAATLTDGRENRLYLEPLLHGRYPQDVLDWIGTRSPMASRVRDGDMKTIGAPVDLLGVAYYDPIYIDAGGGRVTRHPTSVAGWHQIHPEGLYDVLVRLGQEYGDVPVLITENGVASPDRLGADGTVDDPSRIDFLRAHLAAVHRALGAGVRLEGYHVWSLLDNFEWAEGYSQRWGLVYVDYPTQRRVPKRSALWYRDVIRANAVAPA